MRFLWKDWPAPAKTGTSSNSYLTEILIPGETWQSVGAGYGHATAAAANSSGEVNFNDLGTRKGYHVLISGSVTASGASPKEATAQAYGPDGRVFSVINSENKIVTSAQNGRTTTFAKGIHGTDVVVRHDGLAYVTEPPANGKPEGRIWRITAGGKKQIVDTCRFSPSGITLSPDQTLLYVADLDSFWVYSYQIAPDGTLSQKQRYFHLHQPQTANNAGTAGMCCDTDGRLYVATTLGVQVCDQAGRVECIIPVPNGRAISLAFGSATHDTLFVACGEKVYKRKTRVHGAVAFGEPTKPAAPRL
jgi:gluconolactonase